MKDENKTKEQLINELAEMRQENMELKKLEIERKEAEERIDFLLEILKTTPISVIATNKNKEIIYVNPATEKLFGYKKEELLGKDPEILNAEPNADQIQKEIIDIVRREKVWKGEILNKKKNGDLFYIYASVYQLLDEKGSFIAMVGFQEDVTERKKVMEICERARKSIVPLWRVPMIQSIW